MKNALCRLLLCGLLLIHVAACGTLLFPDRRNQPAGDLDPNILVLDGIGLFFFVVPGVVSYIVDFTTGAIYLPEGVERGEGPFFD